MFIDFNVQHWGVQSNLQVGCRFRLHCSSCPPTPASFIIFPQVAMSHDDVHLTPMNAFWCICSYLPQHKCVLCFLDVVPSMYATRRMDGPYSGWTVCVYPSPIHHGTNLNCQLGHRQWCRYDNDEHREFDPTRFEIRWRIKILFQILESRENFRIPTIFRAWIRWLNFYPSWPNSHEINMILTNYS